MELQYGNIKWCKTFKNVGLSTTHGNFQTFVVHVVDSWYINNNYEVFIESHDKSTTGEYISFYYECSIDETESDLFEMIEKQETFNTKMIHNIFVNLTSLFVSKYNITNDYSRKKLTGLYVC